MKLSDIKQARIQTSGTSAPLSGPAYLARLRSELEPLMQNGTIRAHREQTLAMLQLPSIRNQVGNFITVCLNEPNSPNILFNQDGAAEVAVALALEGNREVMSQFVQALASPKIDGSALWRLFENHLGGTER